MRKVGLDVRAHKECDWLNSDVEDDIWIPDVTAKGWIIFSSDKRISMDPVNVRAVLESKAQVIMTSDNNRLPEFWGAAFIVGRLKILEVLNNNPGPVFIRISHCTGEHVRIVRQTITHPQLAPKTIERKAIRGKQENLPDFGHIKF
jgi:hypothetical protein